MPGLVLSVVAVIVTIWWLVPKAVDLVEKALAEPA